MTLPAAFRFCSSTLNWEIDLLAQPVRDTNISSISVISPGSRPDANAALRISLTMAMSNASSELIHSTISSKVTARAAASNMHGSLLCVSFHDIAQPASIVETDGTVASTCQRTDATRLAPESRGPRRVSYVWGVRRSRAPTFARNGRSARGSLLVAFLRSGTRLGGDSEPSFLRPVSAQA